MAEKKESGLISFLKSFAKSPRKGPSGPRIRKRFTYDLKDTSLDPVVLAEEVLQGGISSQVSHGARI